MSAASDRYGTCPSCGGDHYDRCPDPLNAAMEEVRVAWKMQRGERRAIRALIRAVPEGTVLIAVPAAPEAAS